MAYLQKSSTKSTEIDLAEAESIEADRPKKNQKLGHRARVKEKFTKQDVSLLPNVDLIEALLFFCNPRRDVRNEAKELNDLARGSILKFLFLTEEEMKFYNIKYVKDNLLFLNKIILELTARFFRDRIIDFTFKNLEDIKNYLITRSAFLTKEELRILYLNSKNKLIDDEVISRGTINETAIYIREVVSLALKKSAMSIIISHNHPSGEVAPSREDIKVTYDLKQALLSVSITLQDHIVTSGNRYFSFKKEGLL